MPFGFRGSSQSLVVSLYASVPWHNPLDCSSEEILTPVHGVLLPIQVVLSLNHSAIQGCKHWGWQWLLPFKKDKLSTQFSEGLHANLKNLLHTTPPAINTLRFICVGFNKIIGRGGSQSKGLCYVLCHKLWPVIMDITVTLISQHNVVKCKLLRVLGPLVTYLLHSTSIFSQGVLAIKAHRQGRSLPINIFDTKREKKCEVILSF